ncbi:P-loop containing nucleoside triphosphate hydrolase protein [Aspergillus crustosus]
MQPWTSRGSYCLIGRLRAPLCPRARTFATTPVFQRTSRAKKAEILEARNVRKESKPKYSKSFRPPLRPSLNTFDTESFSKLVANLLQELKDDPHRPNIDDEKWDEFERFIRTACKVEVRPGDRQAALKSGSLRQVKVALQTAFIKGKGHAVARELEYLLHDRSIDAMFSLPVLEQQKKIADLRYPSEWYPQARATQRTIHLHVGPTNSGKTYHALKRLQESKNGFYAGPLRLLAQEVHQRFQASGIPCSLITGDEVKIPDGEKSVLVCNTVEMVNLGEPYEVGVIDEIQMISDPDRGWAWTRAVLGSRVKELHLCGETRTVPLIRELAALNGDKLEIHRYERLNPLQVETHSLQGDLSKLQKGDCVVAFSRIAIHALKQDIEKITGRRAAIVYGGLPAEIRTQQASLFNDPDNDYDFLVASDAIGMGLNLSIKRIIFETLVKRLPDGLVRLSVPEIKQIGGRAGRYRPAVQQNNGRNSHPGDEGTNAGYVTALEEVDLPWIRQALESEPPPLKAAGLNPPDSVFEKIGPYYPEGTPLEYIIRRLVEISEVSSLFFMCKQKNSLLNAEVIDCVPGLQLADQLTFMAAPINAKPDGRNVAIAFAQCVAEHTNGRLLEIDNLNLEVLEKTVSGSKEYLKDLEALHTSVILYNWLSYRFGGVFTDRTLAVHVKELVEERMVRALTEFSSNKKLQKNASLKRQIALQKQILEQKKFLNPDAENEPLAQSYGSEALNTSGSEGSVEVDLEESQDFEDQSSEDIKRASTKAMRTN